MDYERAIKRAINTAKNALDEAVNLKNQYEMAKKFTDELLEECKASGIETVCIGVRNKAVASSTTFPFGASGSLFAAGRQDGWPAIWGVADRMGIGAGCGNTDQKQVDTSNLVDGTYHFKDGQWLKVSGDYL